jgi:CheY-like chemotaxis protein
MTNPESLSEPKATPGKTILFVEDDLDFREVIAAGVEEATCYRVVVVADGCEAMKIAKTLTPDLFLLDYHLPGLDGLEVCERLHTIRGLEHVPTLFLTAYPFRLGLKTQVHTFLCLKKPIDFNELLACIQALLGGELTAAENQASTSREYLPNA